MQIPPWLVGTDPVAMYAEGLRLGTQQAGEAARIQAQQESALREQQRMAVDEQIRSQQLSLQMQQQAEREKAQARRYAAQERYQTLISSGVDPAKALLSVAPDLGESLTGAAQLYRSTQAPTMTPYQQAMIEIRREEAQRRAKAATPASIVEHPEFPGQKFLRQPTGHEQLLADKEPTQEQKDRLTLQALHAMRPTTGDDVTSPEWQQQTNRAAQVLSRYLTPPKTQKTGRIRVKSKDGKIGTIPAEQLDEAKKEGYTEVE